MLGLFLLFLWHFELRMPKLAVGSLIAEARQIARARLQTPMHILAVWTKLAEAAFIPGAVLQLILRPDMQEVTVRVGAHTKVDEEMAWLHLAQVILVKELAILILLAQTAQPVLTDNICFLCLGVSHSTLVSSLARAFLPIRAERAACNSDSFMPNGTLLIYWLLDCKC